jgi:hypothetical protein
MHAFSDPETIAFFSIDVLNSTLCYLSKLTQLQQTRVLPGCPLRPAPTRPWCPKALWHFVSYWTLPHWGKLGSGFGLGSHSSTLYANRLIETTCFLRTSKAEGMEGITTIIPSSAPFQSLLSSCHSAPGVREPVCLQHWYCSRQRPTRLCLLTALCIPGTLPDFFSYFKVYQTLGRQHQSLFLLSFMSYRKSEPLEASKLGKKRQATKV